MLQCGARGLLLLLGLMVVLIYTAAAVSPEPLHSNASADDGAADAGRELAGKPGTNFPANVHRCVHAATKLAKQTKAGSPCLMCDPALPECNTGCQLLVNSLYHVCAKQCLPPGYFFDPQMTLGGCFRDNLDALKIKIERCGCNSALSLSGLQDLLMTAALTLFLTCFFFVGGP